MARVKGPMKGVMVISIDEGKEFSQTVIEPVEMGQDDFDALLAGGKDIILKAVHEDGHLRFELDSIVDHT